MKIALCSKGKFYLEKGFTKNRIELAGNLEKFGWETVLVDKKMIEIPATDKYNAERYNEALKKFFIKNASKFDVVLYEYDTLPFNRNLFNKTTLFVARPAILAYHFLDVKLKYNLKTRISKFLRNIAFKKNNSFKTYLKKVEYGLQQADLIQVQNVKDRQLLIKKGFSTEKIVVIPNGITPERIIKFAPPVRDYSRALTIAYVGTFDFRKGALDFPVIFRILKKKFPNVKLKLLGTKGIFQTEKEVLNFFPNKLKSSIEVVPEFKADELPGLLNNCHLGIFPSYLESFGFGALEMMCAALPVVAYDSPGPSDFVPIDLLVPTGDPVALAAKIAFLIEDTELLARKAGEVREKVIRDYSWKEIAEKAAKTYKEHLKELPAASFLEAEEFVKPKTEF